MDKTMFTSLILLIIIIGTLIFVIITGNEKITQFKYKKEEIPNFSVDVIFNLKSSNFRMEERKLDCNIDTLIECDKRNESETLLQCKELLVKCINFPEKATYVYYTKKVEIPKNKDKNTGYALAVTEIYDEACNFDHGNLVLITSNETSNEYMLICECKQPGYIGKDHLLKNCDVVYMCNGKIDNIKQSLDKIKCICDDGKINDSHDGVSYCRDMTISEANGLYTDWSHLVPWNSERQIGVEAFKPAFQSKLKTSKLLDPCRNSLLDTSIEITGAKFNVINGECQFRDYGYPVERKFLNYTPTLGMKEMEKYKNVKDAQIGAGIPTEKYVKIRYLDNVNGERKIIAIVVGGINFDNKLYNSESLKELRLVKENILLIAPLGTALSDVGPLLITTKLNIIAPQCIGDWPKYYCWFNDYCRGIQYGLPQADSRSAPKTFLWLFEFWNKIENALLKGTIYTPRGILFNNKPLLYLNRFYGLQFVSDLSDEESGVLLFTNQDNYKYHKLTALTYQADDP